MRTHVVLLGFASLLALAPAAHAVEADVVVQHQGRILDLADVPVDGPKTLELKLYSKSDAPRATWCGASPTR